MKKRLHSCIMMFLAVLLVLFPFAGCAPDTTTQGGYDLSSFSVVPQQGSDQNIALDGSFIITCDSSFKEDVLNEIIRLEPSAEYTLESLGGFSLFGGGGEYLLTPTSPLAEGEIYNVVIGREGVDDLRHWAFQTEIPVGIVGFLPGDGNKYADIFSGIEFTTSHDGMDISENFSIEPHVDGSWDSYGRVWVFMPSTPLATDTHYTATIKAGVATNDPELVMEEDYVASFRTSDDSLISVDLNGSTYETFMPEDPLVVSLYSDGYESDVDVSIYRLPDGEEYLNVLGDYYNYSEVELGSYGRYHLEDVSDYEEVYSGTLSPAGDGNDKSYSKSYLLPGQEIGWYVAQVTVTPSDLSELLPEMEPLYNPTPMEDLEQYLSPQEIEDYLEQAKLDFERELIIYENLSNIEPITITKMIQISDYGVFNMNGESDALVWVNDSMSGGAAQGLNVDLSTTHTFAEKNSATTNADGIAQLKAFEVVYKEDAYNQSPHLFTRIMKDEEIVYVDLNNGPLFDEYSHYNWDYVSLLYLDRPLYMPTDTVNVWGMLGVRPGSQAELPEELWLNLTSWSGGKQLIQEHKVTLDENGGFNFEFSIEDYASGYYDIYLTHRGGTSYSQSYAQKSFQVKRYTKPTYTTTLEANALWYEPGDQVEFDITSSFFDGTPAAGQTYSFEIGNATFDDLTTDAAGKTSVSFAMGDISSEMGYTPYSRWYGLQLVGMEDYYSIFNDYVLVIPRNVILQTDYTLGDNGYDVEIKTSKVDTSKITEDGEVWDYTDFNLAGDSVDIPLTAELYRVDLIQTQTGEYYDYISGQVRYTYSYHEQESLVETYNLVTSNGIATIEGLAPDISGDFHYELRITGKDLNDREFYYDDVVGRYTSSWRKEREDLGYKEYRLFDSVENNLIWYKDMTEGEILDLTLYENDRPFTPTGNMLNVVVRDDIMSASVSGDGKVSIEMTEDKFPQVTVHSAYFDGKHIYPINQSELHFAPDERELELEISTDKERYTPGQEVSASLSVTHDGKPVPNAAYVISVVDEALFALIDQDYVAIGDMYKYARPQNMYTYVSYVQYLGENLEANYDSGGGKGGGGGEGESERMDFYDTASFISGTTDEQGKAEVSFTLPDNLTSWRLTSAAYSEDYRQAGDTAYNVNAGLDFFVQPLLNDIYLVGDDIVFTARGRTNPPSNMSGTTYTAQLMQGDEVVDTLEGSGELATFNFGKRPAGNYTMKMSATHGENADSVLMDFVVLDSALERAVITDIDLSQPLDIESVRYPVSISFYDKDYEMYNKVIQTLLASEGRRIDQRIARDWALEQLKENGQDLPYYLDQTVSIEEFESSSPPTGLSLFEGQKVDWLLTGKVGMVAPSASSVSSSASMAQRMVYEGYIEREPQNYADRYPDLVDAEQRLGAYLTMAAADYPILGDLRSLLDDPAYTWQERAIIAAALGTLGDYAGAQAVYDEDIAPLLVRENDWAYIPVEGGEDSRDMTYEATTRALMAAASFGSEDAELLANYLCGNPSDKSLANLELMMYAKNFPPLASAGGSLSYTMDGQSVTLDLEGRGVEYVTFNSPEALQNADIKVLSGDVAASAYHVTYADSSQIEPVEGISINRSFYPLIGDATDTFSLGELIFVNVSIEIDEFVPSGYYTFEDYLPSGARLVDGIIKSSYYANSFFYYQGAEEQKLTYGVYISQDNEEFEEFLRSTDGKLVMDLSYTIRCALPGEYVVPSGYLTHHDGNSVALSSPGTITINPTQGTEQLATIVSYSQSEA